MSAVGFSHIRNMVRRRGIGYFRYLLTGVVLPKVSYRYVWGPSAFAPIRRAFRRTAARFTPPAVAAFDDSAWSEESMDRLHRAGITGVRHVLNGERGRLRRHAELGIAFAVERNADRCAFNTRFGTRLLTEATARSLLQHAASRVTNGYKDYAPIDFGGGLTLGRFLTTDSGTGRWQFFNRTIVAPLISGARVLDLGCNNGSLPLMMLRAGAQAVVGVEATPEIADLARANGRILSWRDIAPYDFRVITGDMRLFLNDGLGRFDVVTAFCSLYYLPVEDMARVIAKAADSGATLVLQANESISNLPAGARQLADLMTENGYDQVNVYEYPGYLRPLLVGTPASLQAA